MAWLKIYLRSIWSTAAVSIGYFLINSSKTFNSIWMLHNVYLSAGVSFMNCIRESLESASCIALFFHYITKPMQQVPHAMLSVVSLSNMYYALYSLSLTTTTTNTTTTTTASSVCVPSKAKVIWRRGHGLKADWPILEKTTPQ